MADEKKEKEEKKAKGGKKTFWIIFLAALLVIVLGGFGWSFWQYRVAQKQVTKLSTLEGQMAQAKDEKNQLMNDIKKLIKLPDGEEPTIVSITDVDKLKEKHDFFKDAKNGNVLLIYANAKKAIIYDKEAKQIVNVGPLIVDKNAAPANNTTNSNTK